MAKAIVVKPMGNGEYKVQTEGQNTKTVSDMNEDIIPLEKQGCNADEHAQLIAEYFYREIYKWGNLSDTKLCQGYAFNSYVHVIVKRFEI